MNLQEYFRAHYTQLLEAVDMVVEKDSRDFYTGKRRPASESKKHKEALLRFISEIMSMVPNEENADYIIVSQEYYDSLSDSEEPCVTTFIYKIEDLKSYNVKKQLLSLDIEKMTDEEIMSWYNFVGRGSFITPWGYWTSPWEDWMGLTVYEKSMEEHGIASSFADIIREMTFNGTTRDQQEKRRRELEEISMDAEDDQDEPCSAEGLLAGLNLEDGRSDEERKADREKLYKTALFYNIEKERTLVDVCAYCRGLGTGD